MGEQKGVRIISYPLRYLEKKLMPFYLKKIDLINCFFTPSPAVPFRSLEREKC
jgi:hypothetical protein